MNRSVLPVIFAQIHGVLVIHVQTRPTALPVRLAHPHPVHQAITVRHPAKNYSVQIDIFVQVDLFLHRTVDFLISVHQDQNQKLRARGVFFLSLLCPSLCGQPARMPTKREIAKETSERWQRR